MAFRTNFSPRSRTGLCGTLKTSDNLGVRLSPWRPSNIMNSNKITLGIVLGLILGLVVYFNFFAAKISPIPHERVVFLKVQELSGSGNSMLPLYKTKDTIYFQHIPYNEIRIGSIVVFSPNGISYICHVVVDKSGKNWKTKGINNDYIDEDELTEYNYIGMVVK